ncbi:MAG: cell wall biogenesis protein [Pelagibacteraceae bacterium TMED65]|nr:MAG: cell wall biogenesis protein [Pelagibacteraceae bacterium TMED65]|tara:strand:- start:2741 stop:3895 length:1155 start_codon:yes stop_codon:yes gene_type:complete
MHNIPFGKPLIGLEEKEAVLKVMDGSTLVHGPVALEFEKNFASFTGAPHAISVSSCTAGMHLIYFALGYGPGDEVIVPAQTHIATAHAVELTGAKPVFIDSENETGNIDINLIESAINSKTKAIAVVHYLGAPVNMPKILEIAKKYDLFVLEDCALSPGATIDGIHTGLHGDAGVFSFYPVKHMTTAEGGMIILKDKKLAEKLTLLKAFGVNRTHGERKVPGVYDTIDLGFNYRMSEIHAAIGSVQIKKLEKFLIKRKDNFLYLEKYLKNIPGIKILSQPSNEHFNSCYYCLGGLLDENIAPKRAKIITYLSKLGIGTSVYYPQPVPRMKYYRNKYSYDKNKYSVAAQISDSIIAFPVGPHLSKDEMEIIGFELKKYMQKNYYE